MLLRLFKGHEGCGKIIQIGDQVKDSGLKVVSVNRMKLNLNFPAVF